jgi:ribosomal-protein-alanine N-acetyltransferase
MKAVSEALDMIEWLNRGYDAHDLIQWGVTRRGVDQVIGLFGFNRWDRYHNRAEIGYDLTRAHWGNGFASEALGAMLRFGFDRMQLHRVDAETIADNWESVRLLEKLGFQCEGRRREYSWEDDGTYHDSAIYGLLRQDFQPDG